MEMRMTAVVIGAIATAILVGIKNAKTPKAIPIKIKKDKR